MTLKPIFIEEVELSQTPEQFRDAVNKEMVDNESCKLLKIIKKIQYPYTDKNKKMVVHTAYLIRMNLAILLTHFDFADNVSRDTMVIGDCMEFVNLWNNGRILLEDR